MREIRQSGSEGGGVELNHLSLPLYGLPALRALGFVTVFMTDYTSQLECNPGRIHPIHFLVTPNCLA